METVDILVGIDRGNDLLLVHVLRQRQLHENAIDGRIGVQLFDQREEVGLRRLGRQLVLEARHTGFHRLLALGADVDLARRVLAHQHHGKARLAARLRFERGSKLTHLAAQVRGKGLPIDHRGSHAVFP